MTAPVRFRVEAVHLTATAANFGGAEKGFERMDVARFTGGLPGGVRTLSGASEVTMRPGA